MSRKHSIQHMARTGSGSRRNRRALRCLLCAGFSLLVCLGFVAPAGALADNHSAERSSEAQPKTPVKHFIVLMQENHSFDNYFGTYPGAEGIPAGTCMPLDPSRPDPSTCVQPFHLGDVPSELEDPDHSAATYRLQYNEGHMDGFVSALNARNQNGRLAMGYYDDRDVPYYWNLADEYSLYDRFFSSTANTSFVNHLYWVAGASNGIDRTSTKSIDNIPTIFDRLQEGGISWKFYVQNYDPKLTYRTVHDFPDNRASQLVRCPLLNMDRFIDNPSLSSHIVDLSQYSIDLDKGTLPAVAYIAPAGQSEQPPSSIQAGQMFVRNLVQQLMSSDSWDSSAFMLTYDASGGWYDHVLPPQVDEEGYGFRVPALMIGPYARRGHIDHTQLDYTSVLKFVEDNWAVAPLAARDARAESIAGAFDFGQQPRTPRFTPARRAGGVTGAEPRRVVIYVAYGAALTIAGLLIASAVKGRNVLRRKSTGNYRTPEEHIEP